MVTPHPEVPSYFPQSRKDHFHVKPLGQGTRMRVHASRHEGIPTVLRAPKKTEADLTDVATRTGWTFNGGPTDARISPITHGDILAQKNLTRYIGRNMAPVLPFVDKDMEGNVRVYSTQELIAVARDISHEFGDPMLDLTKKARRDFARLLAGVREMIDECGVIPDLVGHGNVVLTKDERVVLVDINNIRPVLKEGAWCRGEMTQELWTTIVKRDGGQPLKDFLAPDYLDERGEPIGDASLYQLRLWEVYAANHNDAVAAGARTIDVIRADPLYQAIDRERDQWRDRIFSFMARGDIRVP